MALRHFVISSIARFFSEGTSRREMLSRTERTSSCGVFGLFDRLKRNAICTHGIAKQRERQLDTEEDTRINGEGGQAWMDDDKGELAQGGVSGEGVCV